MTGGTAEGARAALVAKDASGCRPLGDARPAGLPATQPRAGRAIVVCEQWLGSDGYAGMKALRRAGWSVRVVPEWEYIPVLWRSLPMKAVGRLLRPLAVRAFNEELLRQAELLRPEFLLVFKGRFVRARTLRRLRATGVRCYCYYPDVSFRAHGQYVPEALPHYDWIFTTKSFGLRDMREQLGVEHASLIMLAYDPDLHRPIALSDADEAYYGCDASYIGTWSPWKERLLGELVRRRPALKLRIWGEQWWRAKDAALRPYIGGHGVLGDEFVRAIRGSKINLAIMSERRVGSSMGDQVAGRTFQIPACGGFMIHDRTDEVLQYFRDGEEVVCYRGLDDLIRKIDEYLPDEPRRRAIAERGRAVVTAAHSFDHRIRQILAHHESR